MKNNSENSEKLQVIVGTYFGLNVYMQTSKHLYAEFPHLKEYTVSLTTNKRMFEAPNNSLKAIVNYSRLKNLANQINSMDIENITQMEITFSHKMKCD